MFCTNCGDKQSERSHFCAKCGARLGNETTSRQKESNIQAQNQTAITKKENIKPKNRKRTAIMLIASHSLVFVIALAALFLFLNLSNRNEEGNEIEVITRREDTVSYEDYDRLSAPEDVREDNYICDEEWEQFVDDFFGDTPELLDVFDNQNNSASNSDRVGAQQSSLIGTWVSDIDTTTHFYADGTGRAEDANGIHEFTWLSLRLEHVIELFADFRRNELMRAYNDDDLDQLFDRGRAGGEYVVVLFFDGIPAAAHPYILEGPDILQVNTMQFGRALSVTPDIDSNFTWVTFTRTR